MLSSALMALVIVLVSPFAPPLEVVQDQIASAESAGPASLSENATIRDWAGNTLREGSNGWTCLPDRPDTVEADPWCVDEVWLEFIDAWANKREPQIDRVGIAYMLVGDTAVSNTDPYATEPTDADDWVTGVPGHLMILVPDTTMLEGISTDHANGGPWIMWPDTPYAHIMVPVDSYYGGAEHGDMEH